MKPITDERKGVPSASGVERIALCPGSWSLERTLPPDPGSEDAASGTRIHAALSGDYSPAAILSDDELETYERCRVLESETVTAWSSGFDYSITREERIWFGERFSGKADFVAIEGTRALLLDTKTGRTEVTVADGNHQLRALACLLWHKHQHLTEITVGIIQPWVSPQVSLCRYGMDDLAQANLELIGILVDAEKSNAPRIPGEKQCRYCRAKAVCPEARNYVLTTIHNPEQEVSTLTGEALGDYLGRIPLVETIVEALKVEAKRRLSDDPSSVPGWALKPGAQVEKIADLQTVFERFTVRNGTVPQFLACLTAAKGKLKDALKELTGSNGKGLEAELEALIAGTTEMKQNAPSLARKSVEEELNG